MTTKAAIKPNAALKSFWKTKRIDGKHVRIRVLYGGRASSKSWDAAIRAVMIAHNYEGRKFLCVRQFQNKIEESVYTLIKQIIKMLGLSGNFKITNNKIEHIYTGSEFIFYGLWRHIDEIKSLEGVNYCWIEEAHNLTPNQWKVLEPTVREKFSEFWVIFNPQILTDFVYQRFVINPPRNTIARKINYTENPCISSTMLEVIDGVKAEDLDEYNHIYGGDPLEDDDSVIIKRSWLNAATDAHIKLDFEPTGSRKIGFDIADDGGDRCVNVLAHGSVCLELEQWKANEDELLKSCKRTYKNAREWKAGIVYDSLGVGASAGAKFNEINEETNTTKPIRHQKFQAGAAVNKPESNYKHGIKNKDMFCNLKAQSWWHVADRLRNTWDAVTNGTEYDPADLISISSEIKDLEKLLCELSTPKKDYDNTDKIKVESKKDLLKREIPSPDLADAFIMAFAPISSSRGILDVLMG